MKFLCLLLVGFVACLAAFGEDTPTVELPTFKVSAPFFSINYQYNENQVVSALVMEVTPKSGPFKSGLRKGYTLVAIDGAPVKGMATAEFLRLLDITRSVEMKRKFTFLKPKGLFTRTRAMFDLTVTIEPKHTDSKTKAPDSDEI